jgi:hypothetical protein
MPFRPLAPGIDHGDPCPSPLPGVTLATLRGGAAQAVLYGRCSTAAVTCW